MALSKFIQAGAIDDIVFIERGDVSVYEFHQQEPMQGYELNCRQGRI